ncbi:hypothetical protein N7466_002165 [Penicillium verhagenii]|uniref:uncharacterized protein n=1 Tax=Penicillium verhagenii TaxID=1562060 RepID=UPI002545818A|nr:uncharacterized protein N7466_002165 [Penicillium verhagenii]KAJ5939031.1 hypothetical protein N7466_002165 [Penicillium verhagenii]
MSRPLHLDTQNGQGHNPRYSFMETPLEMSPPSDIQFPTSQAPVPADSSSSAPQQQAATEQPRDAQHQSTQYFPNEKEQHLQQEGMIPTFSKYPPPDQHPAHFAPYAEPTQSSHEIQTIIQSPMQSPMQSPLHSPLHSPQYPQQSYQYQYQYQQMYQQQQLQLQQQHQQQQTYQQWYQQNYQQQVYHQQHQQAYHQPQSQLPQEASQDIPLETYDVPPSSPGPLPVKTNPDAPTRSDTMTVAPDVNPLQSPKLSYFPPAAASSPAPVVDDLSTAHQPGQIMHPNQEVIGGGWTNGLCDCSSNFAACFMGIFCPCILYGKTQYRLNRKSKGEDPTNMLGYESCNGSCTGMALLCGCQCILTALQRRTTRKAYGIAGDCGSDCVRSTCCCCCTLIQNEKEIQKREEHRNRAAIERGATLSPYMAPGPMSYPPPHK